MTKDTKTKEVDSGVVDKCPECGCEEFLEITIEMEKDPCGRKKCKQGLRCYNCGIILIPK